MVTRYITDQDHTPVSETDVLTQSDSNLISMTYRSVSDPEGFSPMLEQLSTSVGASGAVLIAVDKQRMAVQYGWVYGYPDSLVRAYIEGDMVKHDLLLQHMLQKAPSDFHSRYLNIPDEDRLNDTTVVADLIETLMLGDMGTAVIHNNSDEALILFLHRRFDQSPFSSEELARLNSLVPHLRQSMQLYMQFNRCHGTLGSLQGAVDALPFPAMVFNQLLEVLHCNRFSEKWTGDQAPFFLEEKRLMARDEILQRELTAKMIITIQASLGQCPPEPVVIRVKRESKLPLSITLTPIASNGTTGGGVLMLIYDPEERQMPKADVIAKTFALTPVEGLVCEDLVSGLSADEAAEKRCIKPASIRTYLKRIYKKTGTSRQGELIVRILGTLSI